MKINNQIKENESKTAISYAVKTTDVLKLIEKEIKSLQAELKNKFHSDEIIPFDCVDIDRFIDKIFKKRYGDFE